MRKVLDVFRIISIVIILFLAALVFIPNILGITPTIDLLGTMSPKITKGSISYVNRNYKYNNINTNDVIQIKMYNQDIMVRVESKNEKDKTLSVKGDAESKQEIKVISKKEYIGKHIFSIPKVGLLILFLQRFFFLTVILIIIIIVSLIVDYIDYKNNNKTQELSISKEEKIKDENPVNKEIEKKDDSDKEQEKLEKELEKLKEENNKKTKNSENNKKNKNKNNNKKNNNDNIEILDDEEIKEINKILDSKNKKNEEPEILEIIDENKDDDVL